MSDLVRPPFQHRDNEDGSFDSICTRCFLTVAGADEEDQLASHEAIHVCSPIRLFAIATGAHAPADSRHRSNPRRPMQFVCDPALSPALVDRPVTLLSVLRFFWRNWLGLRKHGIQQRGRISSSLPIIELDE
jgi:hypothetical protein